MRPAAAGVPRGHNHVHSARNWPGWKQQRNRDRECDLRPAAASAAAGEGDTYALRLDFSGRPGCVFRL